MPLLMSRSITCWAAAATRPSSSTSKAQKSVEVLQSIIDSKAVAAALLLALAQAAVAQTYPSRQVTLVVPFAPGGPADVLGRLIGQKMSEDLGQQIVVDNRPGANTIIGAQAVAKASPDGYTLLMAIDGTLVMNPFLYGKLAYDPFKDFVPISLIALVPSALIANINTPVNSIRELVDKEKAKRALLRLVYRLLFLFTIEERRLVLPHLVAFDPPCGYRRVVAGDAAALPAAARTQTGWGCFGARTPASRNWGRRRGVGCWPFLWTWGGRGRCVIRIDVWLW